MFEQNQMTEADEDRVCAHCGDDLLDRQDGPYCDDLCTAEATDDLNRDKELLFERLDALQAENNQLKAQLSMARQDFQESREAHCWRGAHDLWKVLNATPEAVDKWEADKRASVIQECLTALEPLIVHDSMKIGSNGGIYCSGLYFKRDVVRALGFLIHNAPQGGGTASDNPTA